MPTSPTTVIGSRVCASIVSFPPASGKFRSVMEKHVALARGVKFSPVLMRGSMILPYRVSTQCSVVSTDVHPATTRVAASSANELRIFSYLDLNCRGGWAAVRRALRLSRSPQEWDDWPRCSVSDTTAPNEDGLRRAGKPQRRVGNPWHVGPQGVAANVETVRIVRVDAIAASLGQVHDTIADNVPPAVGIAIPLPVDVGLGDHLVPAITTELERDVEGPRVPEGTTGGVVLVHSGEAARNGVPFGGAAGACQDGTSERRDQKRDGDRRSAHATLRVSVLTVITTVLRSPPFHSTLPSHGKRNARSAGGGA